MLSVPKKLVKQPTHKKKGFVTLAKLWYELLDELKEQRKLLVERALLLDQESILKAHRYWKEAKAYYEEAKRATISLSVV